MNKVYKVTPVSMYDILGLQSWLEEMANQGLFPTHLGNFAVFDRTGVPGTRFRLEPIVNARPIPMAEQWGLYQEAGWEYTFSVANLYYLFYAQDPAAIEPHTDREIQGMSLDKLAKRVRRAKWQQWFLLLILPLWVLLTAFWSVRYDVQPDRWVRFPLLFLRLMDPLVLLWLALYVLYSVQQWQECSALQALHRNLREGQPPPPSPGPSHWYARKQALFLVLFSVCIVLLAGSQLWKGGSTLEHFSQPYVELQQLEAVPVGTWSEAVGEEPPAQRQRENRAWREHSLLAPLWYQVEQKGYAFQTGTMPNAYSPDPEDGRFTYSPSLDMECLHLWIPGLAQPVARALLDKMRLVNLFWSYEEVPWPGMDLVLLARSDPNPWQMAALVRGGRVAVFRYAGQEDLAAHLDVLAAVLE